jgi:GNAT superfamily N-acetyltransferase
MDKMLSIVEIKNKRDLKKFVHLPWLLYKDDPYWVPPLKGDMLKTLLGKDNPLFMEGEHAFFMAYIDTRPVGRICVGINESLNEKKNSEEGFMSLFECIDDREVAFAIFDKAVKWLKERGKKLVKGPLSPTNGDDYKGLLVQGFNGSPVLMNSYNPEYYVRFFEEYGFTKHLDLYAYYHDIHSAASLERHGKVAQYAMKRYNFQIDSIDLKNLDKETIDIKAIMDIAMPDDWEELTPPTLEEVRAEVARLKQLADKDLILIARSEGRPIGYLAALPDYNQVLKKLNGSLFPFGFLKFLWYKRKITGLRIFVMFVIPEFRKKAVSGAMLFKCYENAIKNGYKDGEGSTIGETNLAMRNDIEKTGGLLYRTYRLYKKEI